MKRLGGLAVRAFVVALLLLTIGSTVASADPGKNSSSPAVLDPSALPDDPGYTDGGLSPESFPDDPGFGQ